MEFLWRPFSANLGDRAEIYSQIMYNGYYPPIVPAVVLDSGDFGRFSGWLPWPRTEWGVIFGEPITRPAGDSLTAAAEFERQWLQAIRDLEPQLRAALTQRFGQQTPVGVLRLGCYVEAAENDKSIQNQ